MCFIYALHKDRRGRIEDAQSMSRPADAKYLLGLSSPLRIRGACGIVWGGAKVVVELP